MLLNPSPSASLPVLAIAAFFLIGMLAGAGLIWIVFLRRLEQARRKLQAAIRAADYWRSYAARQIHRSAELVSTDAARDSTSWRRLASSVHYLDRRR